MSADRTLHHPTKGNSRLQRKQLYLYHKSHGFNAAQIIQEFCPIRSVFLLQENQLQIVRQRNVYCTFVPQ